MKVRDGSLVVPARLTAGDGAVQDGVKRTDRRHPLYDAWRSYCERHPDEVVERRRRLGDTGEDLAERLAAACSGLLLIIVLAAIDGLKGAFDGVAVSAVVVLGVVAGVCFFIWGVVDSHVNDGRLLGIRRAGDRVNRGRLDPKDFYGWGVAAWEPTSRTSPEYARSSDPAPILTLGPMTKEGDS